MKILNLTSVLSFQARWLSQKYKDDEILTISPIDDENLSNNTTIKCEIGSEPYVLAMVCQLISDDEYFGGLDTGYLSGESNVGEEEAQDIVEFLDECELLIIDENLTSYHPDASNLKAFLAFLVGKFGMKVINLKGEEIVFEKSKFSELKELKNYDGAVVFEHSLDRNFVGGKYFCMVAKINDGDVVKIKTPNLECEAKFKLDLNLKGTIAFLGLENVENYSYEIAKISKV
ncbi:hypothetical protein [Campylobacter geochelonis]|uniref:NADH dehydrogenase I subunit F n=1 Tax=Campylobacter geochelonis TaxID=1780362 RepID=A0A128EAS3_9BACT|nr:hypothetical protein [Campylobacter geochelonis]QKF70544.1 NADH:quinone oxidoreductase I, chain G-like protein (cl35703 superfamily) [Campylobacter geochelonis]CZE46070.1 NADH dehydrogenase I subunit F [Campylobacter geochelonis]CZE46565.1 NADH dehydrogenase I subunit F [Campylobacter geochelonis]CZE50414.1 NADH dehydrogenase I subunit F [Campylobacter geochelonis]